MEQQSLTVVAYWKIRKNGRYWESHQAIGGFLFKNLTGTSLKSI